MQNAFNSKNYNDLNEQMMGVMKNYNTSGKGPCKDETAFEFLKNKERAFIKNLRELTVKEGQKNIQKLDNNLKLAQADLDDMNNMKRLVDEKERIHTEKMRGLDNENKQLDEEVGELKELLAAKKNTLNNMKKRNEQSRKNKKKLVEINNQPLNEKKASMNNTGGLEALNESDDIGIKTRKKGKTQSNNNQAVNIKKRKNEPGCECFIF